MGKELSFVGETAVQGYKEEVGDECHNLTSISCIFCHFEVPSNFSLDSVASVVITFSSYKAAIAKRNISR